MALIVSVICKEGLVVQFDWALEVLQALDGEYEIRSLSPGIGVAEGIIPVVADGKAASVVPTAFTHSTPLSSPLCTHNVPMARNTTPLVSCEPMMKIRKNLRQQKPTTETSESQGTTHNVSLIVKCIDIECDTYIDRGLRMCCCRSLIQMVYCYLDIEGYLVGNCRQVYVISSIGNVTP